MTRNSLASLLECSIFLLPLTESFLQWTSVSHPEADFINSGNFGETYQNTKIYGCRICVDEKEDKNAKTRSPVTLASCYGLYNSFAAANYAMV